MSADFERAFDRTVGHEGDWSNDPRDAGGETRFGITKAVARAFGYGGAMRELPFDLARSIYRLNYWDLLRCDELAFYSADVAAEVFDTAVNCGVGFAGRALQRCLNVLNRGARDFPDVTVDGLVGRVTVSALREYLERRGVRGEEVLLKALNSLQGAHYIELAERRPTDEAFAYGWLANRVEMPA